MTDRRIGIGVSLRRQWPLWINVGVFLALIAISWNAQYVSGRLWWPSDDAYQRMDVARSLAERMAWEVNPGEFAPAFGTLLWPVLLAPVLRVLGGNPAAPWALNILLGFSLLIIAYRFIRRLVEPAWAQALLLALWMSALPLAPLAAGGMEHVLFFVLLLLFLEEWSAWMGEPHPTGRMPALILWAVLLAATRYEGLLLVGCAAAGLALRRRFSAAGIILVVAALPLALFGVYSWRMGWMPVPVSVYLRRAEWVPSDLSQAAEVAFRSLIVLDARSDLRVIALMLAGFAAWFGAQIREKIPVARDLAPVALALAVMVLNLTMVGDREPRYDAWLILLGGWALIPFLGEWWTPVRGSAPRRGASFWIGAAFVVLLGFPLLNRAVRGTMDNWLGAHASALRNAAAVEWAAACPSSSLATDAPGLMVFFTGRPVLDLTGTVSLESFRARRQGPLTGGWIDSAADAHGVAAAVVFSAGVREAMGEGWAPIETWPGGSGDTAQMLARGPSAGMCAGG